MKTKISFEDRVFQLWEYQVSHARLLIRSPQAPATGTSPEHLTNIDIGFFGVEYIAIPRSLRALELASPSSEEILQLEDLLGKTLKLENVNILVAQGKRFPVVAESISVSENDWDILESPIEFRSQFRGNH